MVVGIDLGGSDYAEESQRETVIPIAPPSQHTWDRSPFLHALLHLGSPHVNILPRAS